MNYEIPVFKIRLVRDPNVKRADRPQIRSEHDAAGILADYLRHEDREHLVVMMLDGKHRVIGIHTVAVGTVDTAIFSPKDVLKPAILSNAVAIIIGHNHPSGDPSPSPEDVQVTRRIKEACELMEIALLDHVIVGEADEFKSLKAEGLGF